MADPLRSSLHCHVIVIILTALLPVAHLGCPYDVSGSTQQCWTLYDNQLDVMTSGNRYFFSGVDIEQIRLICEILQQAVRCSIQYKSDCPDTEYPDIEVVVTKYTGVADMCHSAGFYDVYARSQSCFSRLEQSTRMCHQDFRGQTRTLMPRVRARDNAAVTSYCRSLEDLISCVKTKVEVNCIREALDLVRPLIMASVEHSEMCVTDPTTSPPTHANDSKQRGDNAATSTHASTALLALATISIRMLHVH